MFDLKRYALIFVVFILANVAGCGQTGDLYLPEELPEDNSSQKSEDDPEQKSKNQPRY